MVEPPNQDEWRRWIADHASKLLLGRILIHPPSLKWPLSPLLRRGERESTAGLVVVSSAPFLLFARQMARSEADAQDLVQELQMQCF